MGEAPPQQISAHIFGRADIVMVMGGWKRMNDIIDIPEWDLSMMDIIDHDGHHHVTNHMAGTLNGQCTPEAMDHIDCGTTVTAKNPIY